jgi:outer membrane protein assembly factor BamB
VVRVRTTTSCVLLPALVLSALIVAPLAGDARANGSQIFPSDPLWTIAFKEKPVAAPATSADRVVVALQSGIVAYALHDKRELWRSPAVADGPMVATSDRLVVPTKGAIVALDATTGSEVWKLPVERLTAPMVAHGEYVFVAVREQLSAYSLADGALAWTTAGWSNPLGIVEQRSTAHENWLYVPVADGRIVALDLATGVKIWETDKIGIKPAQPLVVGDRMFVGSEAKRFCSFRIATRRQEQEWCADVGAPTVGAPAVDARRVYIVALDNQMWSFDRRNGSRQWHSSLGYRPSAGPTVIGDTVSAPGKTLKLPAFSTATGKPSAQLVLSEELVVPALFISASEGVPLRVAVLYGGLNNEWKLTLAGPPPAVLPSIKAEPLTALPGRVVRLPAGRAPRE